MFRRTGFSFPLYSRRTHSNVPCSASRLHRRLGAHSKTIVSSAALAAYILWYANSRTVHNDSAPPIQSGKLLHKATSLLAGDGMTDSEELRTVVWGSNRSNILVHDAVDVIRTPYIAKWLNGVALRDLVLHRDHGACVDARGDVYQWGNGYSGQDGKTQDKPSLSLKSKNITQLKLTGDKLYALSASGKVYALATVASKQVLSPGKPTPSSDFSWSTGWLWGEDSLSDFVEITAMEPLAWGEKIISIDAGNDHVLALTSKGRTFAHPVNKNANTYGQLGFRKFKICDPNAHTAKAYLDVELIPHSLADPYARSSRAKRPVPAAVASENLANVDDTNIKFCTHFFEVPALKDVQVAQVAAGGRSSFVRTPQGRVLGWGANEYGQIGLGSNVALDTITVPTEVVLWKSRLRDTKCLDITAGGDLTAFTVQRSDSSPTTVDLLMCGNGQWGGLGNNIYSNAQSTPVRARNVSGLLEYSDLTQTMQAITLHNVAVSPTGHILLTLDNISTDNVGGRDLLVWGKNYDSELGNGKKSSVPVPTMLQTSEGGRFMLRMRKAKEVKDLHGRTWKRGVNVEQRAAVGFGNSVVYWKIDGV